MGIALAIEVQIYIFRPMRMTDTILPRSPPRGNKKGRANHFSSSSRFPTGQQQDKPVNMMEHILSLHFLAAGKTSQHERAHSLFFTDSLSHILSCRLSTKRREHPIYGPLVSGKSFFHHSSFLLNQRILRETNWIFSTPVLTSAF